MARGKGPVAMGGWGRPSKGQLGLDPHLGGFSIVLREKQRGGENSGEGKSPNQGKTKGQQLKGKIVS